MFADITGIVFPKNDKLTGRNIKSRQSKRHIAYKRGSKIKMTTGCSFKIMKMRRYNNFFKHLKEKNCQPRTPYQVYFENEEFLKKSFKHMKSEKCIPRNLTQQEMNHKSCGKTIPPDVNMVLHKNKQSTRNSNHNILVNV